MTTIETPQSNRVPYWRALFYATPDGHFLTDNSKWEAALRAEVSEYANKMRAALDPGANPVSSPKPWKAEITAGGITTHIEPERGVVAMRLTGSDENISRQFIDYISTSVAVLRFFIGETPPDKKVVEAPSSILPTLAELLPEKTMRTEVNRAVEVARASPLISSDPKIPLAMISRDTAETLAKKADAWQAALVWHTKFLAQFDEGRRRGLRLAIRSGAAQVWAKRDVFANPEPVPGDVWELFHLDASAPANGRMWSDPRVKVLHSKTEFDSATGPAGERLFSIHIAPGQPQVSVKQEDGCDTEANRIFRWMFDYVANQPTLPKRDTAIADCRAGMNCSWRKAYDAWMNLPRDSKRSPRQTDKNLAK